MQDKKKTKKLQQNHFKKWPVTVIRKELIDISGSNNKAILLNHLLYWTDRGFKEKEIQEYLEEEFTDKEIKECCWIHKSGNIFKQETMLKSDEATIRKELTELTYLGYIKRRKSKQYSAQSKNTYEYRVNIKRIIGSLLTINFPLEEVYIDLFPSLFKDEYISSLDKERCIKEEVVAKKLQELQKEKDIEEDRKKSLELTLKRKKNDKLISIYHKEQSM